MVQGYPTQSFDTAWGESGLHPRAAIGQKRPVGCVCRSRTIDGFCAKRGLNQSHRNRFSYADTCHMMAIMILQSIDGYRSEPVC